MTRFGFGRRLFLILAGFAFVPALVMAVGWGWSLSQVLPRINGGAAWERAAASGRTALDVARRRPLTAADSTALRAHELELSQSLTIAQQVDYLARKSLPATFVVGLLLMAILGVLVSRVAAHLSRQLSRPLDELVGWTALIRRGERLPATTDGRGAPEFDVLRTGMRQMADDLEAGRRAALEAERLAALRESARQVAHELKNPLTPIRFAVSRLKREAPPSLSDTVEVLEIESARLEAMAKSFAQFGRLPEGPPSDIDVGDMLRAAVRTAVPPHLTATVLVEDDVPLLHGNHDALSRAVANVLLNAVDACGASGTITAAARRSADGGTVIAIADTGSGIPADKLASIWTPYVTSKAGGTGLGLAIVQQTVLAHGGRVDASSAVGSGTEIRLHFPAPAPA